jgi:predicted unusual protein kinase regulating ubiquinone biosynthesis (AarF/ABC1/UbiB family)
MMERDRWEQGLSSPDAERWNKQMFKARVFNQLVYNSDPNLGNMLIASDWKIWMIDFSRAFRTFKQLPEAEGLRKIARSLYRGLNNLDRASLKRETGAYLSPYEIKGILARREKILEIFNAKIAEQGEEAVVYELAGD